MLMFRARTPVEALCQRSFRMDCRIKSGNDEGKNERKNRKQNADRRNSYSAAPTGAAAPLSGEAHIYRRSTTVLAKGTLVVFGSASGQASWDVAGTRFAYPFERALPAPACPSPARIAHP